MKKQILALMVCAAFLAPTPGFCMEKENDVDKPKGHLSILPKDPLLVVLDNLVEVKDVQVMNCVSRGFTECLNELFKENKRKKVTLETTYYNRPLVPCTYDDIDFSLFGKFGENKFHLGDIFLRTETKLEKAIFLPRCDDTVQFFAVVRESDKKRKPIFLTGPMSNRNAGVSEFWGSTNKSLQKSEIPEGSILNLEIRTEPWEQVTFYYASIKDSQPTQK